MPVVFGDEKKGRSGVVFEAAQAPQETYDPTEGNTFLENLRAGIGQGMANVARRGTNFLLPDSLTPDFASDASIAEAKRLDKALLNTGGGATGSFIGETAATLPVGTAVRGLQAAAGGRTAIPILTKALTSAPAAAALEGSITSGMLADEGDRGKAALAGGATGLILDRALAVAGRLTKGLVKKSQAADDLEHLLTQHGEDIDIPLASAAGEQDIPTRLVKTLYKEGLPLVPGVEGRLKNQTDDMLSKVRKVAIQEGAPDGTILPDNIGTDAGQAKRILQRGFDKGYDDTVKALDWMVPQNFASDVKSHIRSAVKNVDDTSLNRATAQVDGLMQRYSSGKSRIDGENLLDLKYELSEAIKATKGKEKQALIAASGKIEDLIKLRLKPQGLWDKYVKLAEPYRNFKALQKALKSAKVQKGNFSPAQLAKAAPEGSALEMLGQTADELLRSGKSHSTSVGRAITGLGLGGYGLLFDPISAATAFGGAHVLSSKTAQKALMGNTAPQRAIVEALRRHPQLSKALQSAFRGSVTTQIGDNYGSDQ